MVEEPKMRPAMMALNAVLVGLRKMAADGEPHEKLRSALDAAEELPTLLARAPDLTKEYRDALVGIAEQFPELAFALVRFDEGSTALS